MIVPMIKMRNIEYEKKKNGVEIKSSALEVRYLKGPLYLYDAKEWVVIYKSLKLEWVYIGSLYVQYIDDIVETEK